jgi:threonylcarbamoyladenosine tRNA methylthiotransferase MtaB
MKVAIHTLGCKLNQAESELLARQFIDAGHSIVTDEGADIHVLNTCTVTHVADRKSRHLVRFWRKKNPEALVVATGCYAQRAPEELAQAGAGIVVGNEGKMHLIDLLKIRNDSADLFTTNELAANSIGRVRSFIKIQDGCNDFCSYCIVPQVRGGERCLPTLNVINEVRARVSDGYKEVVFTGTKIGDYNQQDVNLRKLVERVLIDTGVERLHLSSLQPQDISVELLELWQDARLCRHFHLALQSGSGTVLKRMRRRYSLDNYRRAVANIRNMVPDVAITADIMVGFPGESEEEFEESYCFCKDVDFTDIHVFTYSARPGTLAAHMTGQVKDKQKRERSQRMLQLASEGARRFRERFLGRDLVVLWENELEPGSGLYSGLSDNYIRLFTHSSEPLTNRFCRVMPVRLHGDGLWAEVKGED